MPNESRREQRKLGSEPGRAHFAALRELETKLASMPGALEELHANSRALFHRDRSMEREGMFRLHPRNPDEA